MDLCAGALLEDKTINKFLKSYSVVTTTTTTKPFSPKQVGVG
jgi:hypothetical protein